VSCTACTRTAGTGCQTRVAAWRHSAAWRSRPGTSRRHRRSSRADSAVEVCPQLRRARTHQLEEAVRWVRWCRSRSGCGSWVSHGLGDHSGRHLHDVGVDWRGWRSRFGGWGHRSADSRGYVRNRILRADLFDHLHFISGERCERFGRGNGNGVSGNGSCW
jgi:hypothetical protein